MKIKSIVSMLFFVMFSTVMLANENLCSVNNKLDSVSNVSNSVFSDFFLLNSSSLSFGIGLTSFHGDIMEKENLSLGYSIHLDVPMNNLRHLFQLGLITGNLSGQDFSSSYNLPAEPLIYLKNGESFKMQFIELDINYVINLSMMYDDNVQARLPQWNKLDFLCKMGFGLNMFRSLRQELQTENFINSYGYEWSWQNNFDNAGTEEADNVTEAVLLFGVISRYNVSDYFDVDFTVTSRYGNTDKWDAKVQNNNDFFMFYSLGINFKLNKN